MQKPKLQQNSVKWQIQLNSVYLLKRPCPVIYLIPDDTQDYATFHPIYSLSPKMDGQQICVN